METDVLALLEINNGLKEIEKWESSMKKVTEAINVLDVAHKSGSNVLIYAAIQNIRKTLADINGALANLGNRICKSSITFKEGASLRNACILVNNERKSLDINDTLQATDSESKTGYKEAMQVPTSDPRSEVGVFRSKTITQASSCSLLGQTVTTTTYPSPYSSPHGGFDFGMANQAPNDFAFSQHVATVVSSPYSFGQTTISSDHPDHAFIQRDVTTASNPYTSFGQPTTAFSQHVVTAVSSPNILNDTSNATDRVFAITSKLHKILK